MKNNDNNEFGTKLSYRIARVIGATVVSLWKSTSLFNKFNIRLALRISVLSLLLLMVYVEFLQNQDRNNELLYDALIPGKSTSDNFYAFEKAGGLDNEPYWNGYLVEYVAASKPKIRFYIELSRDPVNTKGISFETLKSDLEYLCGTKWYIYRKDLIDNYGKYKLKDGNSCTILHNHSGKGYEYNVSVERN